VNCPFWQRHFGYLSYLPEWNSTSDKLYTKEFRIVTVRQVNEKGYPILEVTLGLKIRMLKSNDLEQS